MEVRNLFSEDAIHLVGDVDYPLLASFDGQLKTLLAKEVPATSVTIFMTSRGGFNDMARALRDRFRMAAEILEVDFVGSGFIWSAAMTAMMSFPVEHRFATKETTFLIHQSQNSPEYHLFGMLEARRLLYEEMKSDLSREEQEFIWIKQKLAEGLGRSMDEIDRMTSPATSWTAEDALSEGFICGIV